jgi:hypothetical protein
MFNLLPNIWLVIEQSPWRPIGLSRSLHFLHNRLIGGGEVVSLTRRPRFTPQKHRLLLISVRG